MAIWLLSEGYYSEYSVLGLYEAPDDLDVRATVQEWHRIGEEAKQAVESPEDEPYEVEKRRQAGAMARARRKRFGNGTRDPGKLLRFLGCRQIEFSEAQVSL